MTADPHAKLTTAQRDLLKTALDWGPRDDPGRILDRLDGTAEDKRAVSEVLTAARR